jgi:hypothetical protein
MSIRAAGSCIVDVALVIMIGTGGPVPVVMHTLALVNTGDPLTNRKFDAVSHLAETQGIGVPGGTRKGHPEIRKVSARSSGLIPSTRKVV